MVDVKERPTAVRWCITIIGLVVAGCIVAAGLYVVLHFCSIPVFEYYDTLSWDKVPGTVVGLELKNHEFDCYVQYNYTVEGVPFQGTHTRTIGHHGHFEDHGHYELCRILNETRGTGEIEVQYNPRDPVESALKVTFVGDFWLAMHAFESLALVALGGAVIFWATQVEMPIFLLSGLHATLIALTMIPVSAVRVSRGHVQAVGPLIFGIVSALLAAACCYQMSCFRRATKYGRQKVNDTWWFAEEDKEVPEHFFEVDDEPNENINNSNQGTVTVQNV